MIKNNVDKLLILEDTCKFVSDFNKSYNEILNKSKSLQYDILYIGYSGIKAVDKKLFIIENGYPRLTSSYIISLDGAKKILNKLAKIDYPFDELLGEMVNNKEVKGYRSSRILTYKKFQMNKPEQYYIL